MRIFGSIIRVYEIYSLIFKRHMTPYIETCYGNVWKNLKFLLTCAQKTKSAVRIEETLSSFFRT